MSVDKSQNEKDDTDNLAHARRIELANIVMTENFGDELL